MADPGVNQRDHPNDNADPAHENLDDIQQKIANLEKLFDQQSHSLQYLTSAVERLANTAKPKHTKRKRRYFASSIAVSVAVHHLRMMSFQKGKKQQTLRSVQTLSKKQNFW